MNTLTEKEIVTALKQNNRILENQVHRQLYPQYYYMIRKLILSNSGNEDDTIHTYHDGLIGFMNKCREENFVLTCSIKTMLYSICRNIWLNELRKRKKNREVQLNESLQWKLKVSSIQKQLELEQGKQLIHKILDELELISTKCYKVIQSFYFEEKRLKEVMVDLDIATVGATKAQKDRCIKKLKKIIIGEAEYQTYLKGFLKDL